MDKELIEEILNYVEESEESIDKHWGGRSFQELVEDGDAPDFYFKLKNYLNKNIKE